MTEAAHRETDDEEVPTPVDLQTVAAQTACVDHARDLIAAAKSIQASGQANIAYHLATLPLEELGRRALIGAEAVARAAGDPAGWPRKAKGDHVRKLFWCFFGGNFLAEQMTAKSLSGMENLARRIHETRKAGLYVDHGEEGLSVPKDAVASDEVDQLIAFADGRCVRGVFRSYAWADR